MIKTVVLIGCAMLAGCYRYVPVSPETASVGTHIRADVRNGNRFEGRLVETSQEGVLFIEVPTAAEDGPVGVTARRLFSRVSLDRADITRIEVKKLDRIRTTVAITGFATLAIFLVRTAFGSSGGGSEDGGPPVDQTVVPARVQLHLLKSNPSQSTGRRP